MTNPSPDTSAAEVVAWRHETFGGVAVTLTDEPPWEDDLALPEPLVPKSLLDTSRAETAAANARAEALEREMADWRNGDLRGVKLHMDQFFEDWQAAEAKLAKAVEALRRLDEATAISTNSESADRAFSFVHAVAATVLTEIEGKSK